MIDPKGIMTLCKRTFKNRDTADLELIFIYCLVLFQETYLEVLFSPLRFTAAAIVKALQVSESDVRPKSGRAPRRFS